MARPKKTRIVCRAGGDNPVDLKAELQAYLEKRKEFNADEAAKEYVPSHGRCHRICY